MYFVQFYPDGRSCIKLSNADANVFIANLAISKHRTPILRTRRPAKK